MYSGLLSAVVGSAPNGKLLKGGNSALEGEVSSRTIAQDNCIQHRCFSSHMKP